MLAAHQDKDVGMRETSSPAFSHSPSTLPPTPTPPSITFILLDH